MKGIHNVKAGVVYEQTFLTENDHFGIVDPTFNAPCLTTRHRCPGIGPAKSRAVNDPTQCGTALSTNPVLYPTPFAANASFVPILGCI